MLLLARRPPYTAPLAGVDASPIPPSFHAAPTLSPSLTIQYQRRRLPNAAPLLSHHLHPPPPPPSALQSTPYTPPWTSAPPQPFPQPHLLGFGGNQLPRGGAGRRSSVYRASAKERLVAPSPAVLIPAGPASTEAAPRGEQGTPLQPSNSATTCSQLTGHGGLTEHRFPSGPAGAVLPRPVPLLMSPKQEAAADKNQLPPPADGRRDQGQQSCGKMMDMGPYSADHGHDLSPCSCHPSKRPPPTRTSFLHLQMGGETRPPKPQRYDDGVLPVAPRSSRFFPATPRD
nr:lysine-rich arabinogalactan protein 19-like isoform X1 [Lolium perenne]XP_051209423.1 lysine-rich arabinogalactan protein 19-like isoform X2 [Lolium perenne]